MHPIGAVRTEKTAVFRAKKIDAKKIEKEVEIFIFRCGFEGKKIRSKQSDFVISFRFHPRGAH